MIGHDATIDTYLTNVAKKLNDEAALAGEYRSGRATDPRRAGVAAQHQRLFQIGRVLSVERFALEPRQPVVHSSQ